MKPWWADCVSAGREWQKWSPYVHWWSEFCCRNLGWRYTAYYPTTRLRKPLLLAEAQCSWGRNFQLFWNSLWAWTSPRRWSSENRPVRSSGKGSAASSVKECLLLSSCVAFGTSSMSLISAYRRFTGRSPTGSPRCSLLPFFSAFPGGSGTLFIIIAVHH